VSGARGRRLAALDARVQGLEQPSPGRPHGPRPYAGTFLDFLADAELAGPTWVTWATFWKAVDAVPLTPAELAVFTRHTGRTRPPAAPVREAWLVCGRRSGKSRMMAARAAWTGIRRDWRTVLARGERATIPLIAADRTQSTVALHYLRGLFELPAFAPFVRKVLSEEVELRTGATVTVHTCSYRSVRGITCPVVIGDETAFWSSDDGAASPDAEVLLALRPTLSTIADGLLLAGSTPYSRAGAVWKAFERHFGRDDADVLVWNADVASMNPGIDPALVRAAFVDDAASAASEYGQEGRVAFRTDVEAFLPLEVVQAVTVPGRFELPPVLPGPARDRDPRAVPPPVYVGFVDAAGGTGGDSFTCAVAHPEGERVILDALRERRPPFSPTDAVEEISALLRSYRLGTVTGDRWAGGWVPEAFRRAGIEYRAAERVKSDVYRDALALFTARRVELLEHGRLQRQLVALERRVGRGTGRDVIDHGPHGNDDCANAACGALLAAADRARADLLPGGFRFDL